jgi:outer membrane protein assembly factor BamA
VIEEVLGTAAELTAALENSERVDRIVGRLLFTFGYHDARVERVWSESIAAGRAAVHISVDAGPRASVAGVQLIGSDPLGLVDHESFGIERGVPMDRALLDREASRIRRQYQNNGYGAAHVRAVPVRDEVGEWRVELHLEPGVQRTVSGVEFSGLRHVRERFLRKGLVIDEGDLVVPLDVDTSAVRIANFSPVERVDVVTRPSGTTGSDIEMAVTEKARWTAEVGLGWSSERGLEARLGVRDDNLFGRGVGLNLRGRWNQIERIALLYSALPPLPGGRVSFGSTIAYRKGEARENPELLDEERRSASLEMTYRLSQSQLIRPFYRYTKTHTFERDPDPFFPFEFRLTVATLGAQFLRDRFDNPFDPRSGYGFSSSLEWSGTEIGSDLDTVRLVLNGTLAHEPWDGWTWVQTGRIGGAEPLKGTRLDPEFRFFAGGQGSIRGFDRDSVGPTIEWTGVPTGGGALLILNEELRFPVWGSLRAAAFADIGQVWEDWQQADLALAVGAGLGIRWSTPVGLVWADVAWPVANTQGSSVPKFYLGIGRPF